MRAKFIRIFTILVLCSASFPQTSVKNPDPAVKKLGGNFAEFTADVNGTTIHYVRGGKGAAVILVHGFPQDWSEFKKVMPLLSKNFDVIAVDTRGIGGEESFAPLVACFAESIRQKGCRNVQVEIIKNARHYVADEQPDAVAALIEKYAAAK